MAVDDAGSVEVIGRQLDANAVAGEDADPEAAHLAGDVTEDEVIVVELHPEHGVRESLGHLTLELDLLFFRHVIDTSTGPRSGACLMRHPASIRTGASSGPVVVRGARAAGAYSGAAIPPPEPGASVSGGPAGADS